MSDWHGSVRIVAAGEVGATWRLPRRDGTAVGRAGGCGIRLGGAWIPNQLAVLEPETFGWLLRNGPSTRVTVTGPAVRGARYEPGGVVALVRGRWTMHWALDKSLRAEVVVQTSALPPELPWALSRQVPAGVGRAGTAYVADSGMFSPAELHLLAVLFAHEFDGQAAPRNLCETAGELLGLSAPTVKNRANTVRRRINNKRMVSLDTLEELGFYLVHTARALSPDDLTP